jgi:tetratricopeptide (TPR) repeat protein
MKNSKLLILLSIGLALFVVIGAFFHYLRREKIPQSAENEINKKQPPQATAPSSTDEKNVKQEIADSSLESNKPTVQTASSKSANSSDKENIIKKKGKTKMGKELDSSLYERVTQLSEEGNSLADRVDTPGALKKFNEALELIPEPKTDWEAATWLYASIGDMEFQRGMFEAARTALTEALHCPDGIGNVLIHMRLGQCYFELGDERLAADNLTRAYMGGGREAFEDEDPKYFALIEKILKPPAGQDRL